MVFPSGSGGEILCGTLYHPVAQPRFSLIFLFCVWVCPHLVSLVAGIVFRTTWCYLYHCSRVALGASHINNSTSHRNRKCQLSKININASRLPSSAKKAIVHQPLQQQAPAAVYKYTIYQSVIFTTPFAINHFQNCFCLTLCPAFWAHKTCFVLSCFVQVLLDTSRY